MKKLLPALILIMVALLLPSPAWAVGATLSLSPSSGTFNKSCSFTLDIVLDTQGTDTDGTDAILIYDASRFTATSITAGTIYPDYPGSNIDEAGGKITVSGLSSVATPFVGKGTLATINFKVLDNAQVGVSQIKFDFDPNDKAKTTDSNVVERGTASDILNSVVNGSFTVGAGSCIAASPSPAPPGGFRPGRGSPGISTPSGAVQPPVYQPPVYQQPTLPEGGTKELTYTLTIVGAVLTVLGILGLALL